MSSFDVPSLMTALREHPVPLAHMIQLRDVIFDHATMNSQFHAKLVLRVDFPTDTDDASGQLVDRFLGGTNFLRGICQLFF